MTLISVRPYYNVITCINNKDKLPLVLDVKLVSDILRINKTKAYEIVKQEGFPTYKFGRRIVIPREPFFDWLENR